MLTTSQQTRFDQTEPKNKAAVVKQSVAFTGNAVGVGQAGSAVHKGLFHVPSSNDERIPAKTQSLIWTMSNQARLSPSVPLFESFHENSGNHFALPVQQSGGNNSSIK